MRPTVPRRLRPPRLYFRRQTVVRTAATRRHAVVIRRAPDRSSRTFRRRPGAVRVVADLPPGRFVGGSAALQKYIEPSIHNVFAKGDRATAIVDMRRKLGYVVFEMRPRGDVRWRLRAAAEVHRVVVSRGSRATIHAGHGSIDRWVTRVTGRKV